jgi:hypothetical protein
MNGLKIILLILMVHFCFAQDYEARLQTAYNNFDNELTDSLLARAEAEFENLPMADKTAFHKFKAFRAYQMDEQSVAQNHFRELIKIDPAYTLDRLTTSPKLLTLFDQVKIEYLEQQHEHLKMLSQRNNFTDTPWRSLLFPGWEQWHRGASTKAYTWAALGTITLAGTIQSVIRTSIKHQEYLDEKDPARVKMRYKDYNDLYKSQYYWAYSLATVWIASHIDAVFFTKDKSLEISLENFQQKRMGLALTVRF